MIKSKKLFGIICLSLIAFVTILACLFNFNIAKANGEFKTPTTFEMIDGASIRLSAGKVDNTDTAITNGIRFQVKMDETTANFIKNGDATLYMFVAPIDEVDLTKATEDTIKGYESTKWLTVDGNSLYENEDFYQANVVLCNLSETFFGKTFNAVSIIKNGNNYYFAELGDTTRSMYDVVNSAVLDLENDNAVSIMGSNALSGYSFYGTSNYPVKVSTTEQYNKFVDVVNNGEIALTSLNIDTIGDVDVSQKTIINQSISVNVDKYYTVIFKNGDTVLQSLLVKENTLPVYAGTIPTKSSDGEYNYTFKGWNNEIAVVTGDAVYTATFDSTKIVYPEKDLFTFDDSKDVYYASINNQIGDKEITTLGENKVLKLSNINSYWPKVTVNFNQTIASGTTVQFDLRYDGTFADNFWININGVEGNTIANYGGYYWLTSVGTFVTYTITLPADSSTLTIQTAFEFCGNYKVTSENLSTVSIYLDNVVVLESKDTFTFDSANDIYYTSINNQIGNKEIATLGENKVLKLSNINSYWPQVTVNFNQTIASGTTVQFDLRYDGTFADNFWINVNGVEGYTITDNSRYYWQDSVGNWKTYTITLPADSSTLKIQSAFEFNGGYKVTSANLSTISIYLDNVVVLKSKDTFTFDSANDIYYTSINNQIGNKEIATLGENKVLKLSNINSYWPQVTVNFNQTIASGTTISFDLMFEGTVSANFWVNMNGTTGYDHNGYYNKADVGTWKTFTYTLTSDATALTLQCQLEWCGSYMVSASNLSTFIMYVDNVTINTAQ